MNRYRNKYRAESARAQWWDYGWDAAYFITICTRDRECLFGDISEERMMFSVLGQIAASCWEEIPTHAKNTELEEYVVMPNHVHGILVLEGNQVPFRFVPFVETRHALSLQKDDAAHTIGGMRFRNPGKNTISTIIGGYKSAVSKKAHESGFQFQWQGRFHDHIIRDEEEFQRIRQYIIDNPSKWKGDKFHPDSK